MNHVGITSGMPAWFNHWKYVTVMCHVNSYTETFHHILNDAKKAFNKI